jgi:chromosome segregation ATPase
MDTHEQKTHKVENKYKSPMSKLVRFFEGSRNGWKEKAKDAKYQIKLLRKKVKYLEQNKNEFQKRSKNLEIEVQQMKDKEKRMLAEIDRLKKNL